MKFEDLKPNMILWPEVEHLRDGVSIVINKTQNIVVTLKFEKEKRQFIEKTLDKNDWNRLLYSELETEQKFKISEINQRYIIRDFFKYVGDFL